MINRYYKFIEPKQDERYTISYSKELDIQACILYKDSQYIGYLPRELIGKIVKYEITKHTVLGEVYYELLDSQFWRMKHNVAKFVHSRFFQEVTNNILKNE
jgi:hypothetical protein